MAHLTAQQLASYRNGRLDDSVALRHLASCQTCQQKASPIPAPDPLRSAASKEQPDRHPQPATLAAYLDKALTPRRQAQIEQHLQICERCAEVLSTLQRALQDLPEVIPPPELVERVKQQLNPTPERTEENALVDSARQSQRSDTGAG